MRRLILVGSFAQCLMVQRDLSRVGACPLRYGPVVAKVEPVVVASHRAGAERKKGFRDRGK
jgi:hypothetical protein